MTPGVERKLAAAASDNRRRVLHAAGKLDAEIAAVEGTTAIAIRNWRYRRGLPGNARHYLDAAEQHQRLMMQAIGWGDHAMARLLGVRQSTVTRWRARYGVPRQERRQKRDGELGSCGRFSLDALDHTGRAYVQRIADDRWSSWLEEMGATVW